jgi:hypothetical protein
MTLQPCGIEKSHMAVSHGQSLSRTGQNQSPMAFHIVAKELFIVYTPTVTVPQFPDYVWKTSGLFIMANA